MSLHTLTRMYTSGPGLRIPGVKNMGKDLDPEEIRISPRPMGPPRRMTTLTLGAAPRRPLHARPFDTARHTSTVRRLA
eukprot:6775677-Prymnesium_polylepis.1